MFQQPQVVRLLKQKQIRRNSGNSDSPAGTGNPALAGKAEDPGQINALAKISGGSPLQGRVGKDGGLERHGGKSRVVGLNQIQDQPAVTGLDEIGQKPKVTGLDSTADKSKPTFGEGEKVLGLPPVAGKDQAEMESAADPLEATPPAPMESAPAMKAPSMEVRIAEDSTTEDPESPTTLGGSISTSSPAPVLRQNAGAALPMSAAPLATGGPEMAGPIETEVAEEESLEEEEGKGKPAEEFSPTEQRELATQNAEASASRLLENGARLAELSGKTVSYRLPKRLLFRREKMKYRQVQADYLARNFIASSVQKGQDLIAYANAAKPRLEAAAEISKANISAAVQEQVLATQTNTDMLKAQVTADAEKLRKHVNQNYFGAVSTIKANTSAELQKLNKEWLTTKGLVDGEKTGQLKFVDDFHKKGKQNVIDVGNQVGLEAFALSRLRAKYHRNQQEWENGSPKSDGFWDGPYTFNVLEAKAAAAEGVGDSYQSSFQDKGKKISQDADKGKPEDIKAANNTVKEVTEQLLEFYNSSVQGLKDQEKTMLGQAASARATFLTNIGDAEKKTMESLDAQNAQQMAGLLGLEERQRSAVDRNTLNTLAQLNEEIIVATTQVANGIDSFILAQDGQLVPDPDLLAMDLAEKSNQIGEMINGIIAGFETSVANVESSIASGGESAITLITTFSQNGIANAQTTVADIQPGFAQLEEGAVNTFQKMRQSHLGMALKTSKDAKDGLKLGADKLKEGFEKLRKKMNRGMAEMRTNLTAGFREAMYDPKEGIWATIYEKEQEEADKVEPRWKKVLKVLAIIVIVIVVIVLSVVTMGAAVPFLVGAGMSVAAATVVVGVVVGAIGGALMSTGIDLVNGRPVTIESITKAMLIGAIGGAFGGIGGVVASKVVGTAATVGSRVLTFAIEGVFDIAGGVVGDLAAGDLTWQGVLQGFGTGVGIQLAMSRFMKGAKPDVNLKPDVDAPKTKLGEVNAKVKAKVSKAQEKFGGFMESLGNAGEQAGKNFRAKVTGKQAKVDLDGLEVPAVKLDTPAPKTEPVVKPDPDVKVKPETEVPTVKPEAETKIKPEPETVKPQSEGNVEMGFGGKKNRTHPDAEADAEGVVARKPVKGADGQDHEVKVTKKGELLRCSTCDEIEGHYKAELDAPENAKLKQELEQIRLEPDPEVKAQRAQEVAEKLEDFKRSKGMDSEHGQEAKIKDPTADLDPKQKELFDRYKKDNQNTTLSDEEIALRIKRGDTYNEKTQRFNKEVRKKPEWYDDADPEIQKAYDRRGQLNKNMDTPEGQEAHHPTPIETLGSNTTVQDAVKGGYDINKTGSNVEPFSSKNPKFDDQVNPISQGTHASHPNYTREVEGLHQRFESEFQGPNYKPEVWLEKFNDRLARLVDQYSGPGKSVKVDDLLNPNVSGGYDYIDPRKLYNDVKKDYLKAIQ